MLSRRLVPAVICSSLLLVAAGCAPTEGTNSVGTGTGGSSAVGSGGASTTGSGGAVSTGSGGAPTTGSGGAASTGSGGAPTNTGGKAGTGGSGAGTGGSSAGTGGSSVGTGGSGVGTGGSNVSTGGSNAGGSSTGGRSGTGGTTTGTGGAGGSSVATGGCDVWVATDGVDTNAGTESAPVKTFTKAYDLLCPPGSGLDGTVPCMGTGPTWTMCFKSGTYPMSTSLWIKSTRSGTASKMLKIWAAPNATTRPIFDFAGEPRLAKGAKPANTDRGIKVNSDWTHVKGFEVIHANDNGIHVQGANNIVENCVAHDNDDTGIQIGVNTSAAAGTSGVNNTIKNCDSYHNYDAIDGGENADGFGMKEATGTGNKFVGCRAWENSDDGYDLYGWTSQVVFENCWAFSSAKNASFTGANSDGNGFKLGASVGGGGHKLTNCSAWSNKKTGFTKNSGSASTCTGCMSCSNGQADDGVSGITSGGCPSAKGTSARASDGSLP